MKAAAATAAAAAAAAPAPASTSTNEAEIEAESPVKENATTHCASTAMPDRADFCCQICLELMYEPTVTECNHKFCRDCLAAWANTGSNSCPACRRHLTVAAAAAAAAAYPIDRATVGALRLHFAAEYATLERGGSVRAAVRATKIEERRRVEAARALAIGRVKNHFQEGRRMDDEAVAVLLEMFGSNADDVIQFLSADHAPAAELGQRSLVTLAEADSGELRIPRDFFAGIADQPRVELPAPAPGSARDVAAVLLSATSTFDDHLRVQRDHHARTVEVISFLVDRAVLGTMTAGAKARALACCWARRDTELATMLLRTGILDADDAKPDVFGIPEVLKAMRLLDSGRLARQTRRRLARLEAQGTCKKAKLGKLRSDVDNLEREQVSLGSLSGSLVKSIRKVIAQIPRGKLEYYALQMPSGPWREMCDLLHVNPGTGTQCEWFLQFAHSGDAPADSVVVAAAKLSAAAAAAAVGMSGGGGTSVATLLGTSQLPYSVVRQKLPSLSAGAKKVVAGYMPLGQLLWWYEDLRTDELDGIVLGKLAAGESPALPYGKLMERLMLFDRLGRKELFAALLPFAEQQLRDIKLNLDRPVAVLGDASFSMDVAIRTATILSSIMAVISDADLSFFHTEVARPERVPDTAAECVAVAGRTKTLGQTAPAAALWEYYEARKQVKCFVVVSDEGENLRSHGYYFHELYRKYHAEVYPAKLVFVSFLQANEKGQMATAIERMGFGPIKFSFDKDRPDLTKLDALLGTLAVAEL